MIIAINGPIGSGKTTLANLLVKEFGYRRVSFADRLKETVAVLTGCKREDLDDYNFKKTTIAGTSITYRELLVKLGNDIGRDYLSPTYWIDATLNNLKHDIIVDDLRYLNEAEELKKRGAFLIQIKNDKVEQSNHVSEVELLDYKGFDFIINNLDEVCFNDLYKAINNKK